mmetsp:Transcript_26819/g.67522  ORF Transcript_26819/g.67522 Transcript_26819/m.67522 type:complete len:714 (+) Transcript_26819:288-2429(+)|eukprot:CAMPEP_0115234124 /NCGR_PEP_ID=MMETSP0270-20121206/34629_1 /TAXON_ID=71861 /ORGANISM="Scrippsiella trochoidea, Strain CCMP3099" /LENGTH=713 /DNA_ID=CAMNT_0002648857 /DNA_START=182 /DNA_END=2323 /DNA_ORIENTATION=-
MPTILEHLVEDLGGSDLDDKARRSLIDGVNGVHSLSILHRMGGHRNEVRNPSAFVEKSVRNVGGAPAGAQELDNALQRLQQSGLVDENASAVLKKGSVEDACAAISALLTQDTGAVRNASAYVTRNMANARKSGEGGGGAGGARGGGACGGAGMSSNVIGASASMAYMGQQAYGMPGMPAVGYAAPLDPLARWSGMLDQKAIDSLAAVGAIAAGEILQEMESKGGAVRNPSAYVQRACENRTRDGSAAGMAGIVGGVIGASAMGSSGGLYASGSYAGGGAAVATAGRYQGALDSAAVEALQKVHPEEAQQILTNLENRASSVRNPSAYVVRSVANMLGEGAATQQAAAAAPVAYTQQAAFTTAAVPGYMPFAYPGGPAYAVPQQAVGSGNSNTLDEKAVQTLRELPLEVADAILTELQTKSSSINNPSAYVQRAAANARRGEGAAAAVAAQIPGGLEALQQPAAAAAAHSTRSSFGGGSPSTQLDERAQSALAELSPEAATAILQVLEEQGDKVQNPSAYVLKAVGNARKGQGAGGAASRGGQSSSQADLEILLAPWRPQLDAKAQEALEEAGYQAAHHILGELEAKAGSVRNPSAYVAKAVANFKSGIAPAGPGTGAGAGAQYPRHSSAGEDAQASAELAEELARVAAATAGGLDEKAMAALEGVGVHAALSIVRLLNGQGGKVNNPNAYVMRACANEKRAGPPGAKRARID